jgi:hypothetical protein
MEGGRRVRGASHRDFQIWSLLACFCSMCVVFVITAATQSFDSRLTANNYALALATVCSAIFRGALKQRKKNSSYRKEASKVVVVGINFNV